MTSTPESLYAQLRRHRSQQTVPMFATVPCEEPECSDAAEFTTTRGRSKSPTLLCDRHTHVLVLLAERYDLDCTIAPLDPVLRQRGRARA